MNPPIPESECLCRLLFGHFHKTVDWLSDAQVEGLVQQCLSPVSLIFFVCVSAAAAAAIVGAASVSETLELTFENVDKVLDEVGCHRLTRWLGARLNFRAQNFGPIIFLKCHTYELDACPQQGARPPPRVFPVGACFASHGKFAHAVGKEGMGNTGR